MGCSTWCLSCKSFILSKTALVLLFHSFFIHINSQMQWNILNLNVGFIALGNIDKVNTYVIIYCTQETQMQCCLFVYLNTSELKLESNTSVWFSVWKLQCFVYLETYCYEVGSMNSKNHLETRHEHAVLYPEESIALSAVLWTRVSFLIPQMLNARVLI